MDVGKSVERWVRAAWAKVVCALGSKVAARNEGEGHDAAAEVEYWGCGWFDSSHELQRGLAVIDHGADDVLLAVEMMFDIERPASA